MELTIDYQELNKTKRILCISDIHGNLNVFQNLLKKVNYRDQDILIILGDLIEKGNQSLQCVQFIMDLKSRNEVYVISGNCETIWEEIVDDSKLNRLYRYMNFRKTSIIWEMIHELGLQVNSEKELFDALKVVRETYHNELQFLKSLPIILDTDQFIFVHAGLQTAELKENNADLCLRTEAFLEQPTQFGKYVMVGHWPVSNYSKKYPCFNPIVDPKNKKIAIDGGNMVKEEGQLNCFIIDSLQSMNFSFVSEGESKKIIVGHDQTESDHSICITWFDSLIEILDEKDDLYHVKHKSSGYTFWLSKSEVYVESNGIHCHEYTDYYPSLKRGEEVFVYRETEHAFLVKKNGILGWMKKSV